LPYPHVSYLFNEMIRIIIISYYDTNNGLIVSCMSTYNRVMLIYSLWQDEPPHWVIKRRQNNKSGYAGQFSLLILSHY